MKTTGGGIVLNKKDKFHYNLYNDYVLHSLCWWKQAPTKLTATQETCCNQLFAGVSRDMH